jgi:hypothetical protein
VEPAGFLRIRYEARDDVALEQVELEITVEGKKSSVGLTSGLSEYVLDVTTLGLAPGVSASISIRARDGLGQEAASSPRTLRVLPWPPPPEGAGWPAALAELSDSIDAALSDWKRLLASAKDAPPERWAPDAARAERLLEAADRLSV